MPSPISALDLKLGLRMMLRDPLLSLVCGLAIAFGIAVASAGFEIVRQFVAPSLPLPGGDQLVALRIDHEDPAIAASAQSQLLAQHERLSAFQGLGAFRSQVRNLSGSDAAVGQPVLLAEITAEGLALAGVPPLLGRSLDPDDAAPGAPPVVVLGEDTWRQRLAADPQVLGRSVRLGSATFTVVGVMPAGFGYPVAHAAWLPLPDAARDAGEGLQLIARLDADATAAAAGAEVAALVQRTVGAGAEDAPRVRVLAHAQGVVDPVELDPMALRAINGLLLMLLVLLCANVGMLLFARAAARTGDIAVRSALGASRRRLLLQFFSEALVLAAVAWGLGLLAAKLAIGWWVDVGMAEASGALPFWIQPRLSLATCLYSAGLVLLVATIAGLLPARRLTAAGMQQGLRQVGTGASLRFGGIWTLVIVSQVALTMAFPVAGWLVRDHVVGLQALDTGIAADRYLSARLAADPQGVPLDSTRLGQLERRLEAVPGVLGASVGAHLPRTYHPQALVEVEGSTLEAQRIGTTAVAPDFLPLLGVPMRAGRGLHESDLAPGARTVLVNESFVQQVMQGRNPLGARIRHAATREHDAGEWYTVVGVVADAGMIAGDDDPRDDAGIYHAAASPPAPLHLVLHAATDAPMALEPALRAAVAATDPTLRVDQVRPLDEVGDTLWLEMAFLLRVLSGVSAMALLLSLAGIHAILSFTVARRRREIGVRIALGATPLRVLAAVFRRPLRQVALGLAAGSLLATALALAVSAGQSSLAGTGALLAYAVLMLGVCATACLLPARRALQVPASEALRDEG